MTDEVVLQFLIGHSTTTDRWGLPFFPLDDDYVSSRHARVTQYKDGRVTIEDLGSTNGTWVNNVRVYGEHELHPGDVVKIGHTIAPIPSIA